MRMDRFVFLCVLADCFTDNEGEGCFREDGETTCGSEEAVDDGCSDRRVEAVDRSDFGEVASIMLYTGWKGMGHWEGVRSVGQRHGD